MKKQLIKYFKSLGIEVYTNTKARGHQGFFLKNRIDISKNTKEERIIPTLLHEFAHYIHAKIEPDMARNGGSFEFLFNLSSGASLRASEASAAIQVKLPFGLLRRNNLSPRNDINTKNKKSSICGEEEFIIKKELLAVTNFVDTNSHHAKLLEHKSQIKKRIKLLECEIKKDYPKFMRSKKFKEFDKYIKKSKAKYLLKYDRVKLISPFLRRVEIYTIDNLERDFPDMPSAFCACIRLKSAQKKQARISAKINRLNKYYEKPAELFARFIEGLFINPNHTQELAPHSTQRFYELLEQNYYFELKEIFDMLEQNLCASCDESY